MAQHMHEGHRERMKKRFLKEGLGSFEPHEVLELLLFYSRARGDTNPLGHALIVRFGSLSEVFDAPVDQLMQVKGVGENTAVLLKMMPAIARIYLEDKHAAGTVVTSVEDIWDQFRYTYTDSINEEVYALYLDNKNKIIKKELLFVGSVNASSVPRRRLVERAITTYASSVVLSHNHPNGIAVPSKEDKETTRLLLETLTLLGIHLLDHLIVAGENYCSMRESGIIAGWN